MASIRFVHFEIPGENPEALAKFYTQLFGWNVEKAPIPGYEYWICRTGDGPGIDGGITKRLYPHQIVTNFASVDDIGAVLAKAKSLGATVTVPKSAVPGAGWYAVALDPQGNPFGFWKSDNSAK